MHEPEELIGFCIEYHEEHHDSAAPGGGLLNNLTFVLRSASDCCLDGTR
jgi:hypothetical protein